MRDLWERATALRESVDEQTADLAPADRWTILSVVLGQVLCDARFPAQPEPDLCIGIGRVIATAATRRRSERALGARLSPVTGHA